MTRNYNKYYEDNPQKRLFKPKFKVVVELEKDLILDSLRSR